jgi:hypothetical protein
MLTVIGVLVATAPFVVVFALLAWTSRLQRLRRDVQARQVALTDSVHARLGAVAAPVVRRGRRGWQVRIAVPFERPAMTEGVLAIVVEAFAPRGCDQRSLEIVLTRQPDTPVPTPAGARGVRLESLSWT